MEQRAHPGGPEACPPGEVCQEEKKEKRTEAEKSIREMLGELLNRFHPDIDGLKKDLKEKYEANEKTREIIAAYKQAQQGEEGQLRDLYERYILGEEEQVKERVTDLKPHLEKLQQRFREYLLSENEDGIQTLIEEWEKEWQALSKEDQEKLQIIAEMHRSLLALREGLKEYAEFKDFTPNRQRAQAEKLIEALGGKMGEVMDQFEREGEPLDPAAITQALASFMQQVAAQIKLMADEMKSEAFEEKAVKKEEEVTKEEKQREENDADDDYEAEETAAAPARPTAAQVKKDEEEDGKKNLAPLLLVAAAYALVTEGEAGKNEVVPRDQEHKEHLNELKKKDFIDGEWRSGVFVVKSQVLPWCTAPRDVFLLLNLRHYGLFPGSFRHLERPGTDEYFPEAAFLDTTGRAFIEYVNGRWEEYLRSPEYQAYLQEFGFDEEERVL